MARLVIVESPSKAKTIAGILGREYRVVASMGHVRDLPRKQIGVDVDKGFRPRYVTAAGKKKTVERLKDAARDTEAVYLATDMDREGEAIAWHVLQVIRRALPKGTAVHRIKFHEITRRAVTAAIEDSSSLNQALIEAQQTRRILDRLVGYSISPLLWRSIRGAKGLSAGRVQTVALRLVVDREREIEAFVPVEYWTIEALLAQQIADPVPFVAQLWRLIGSDGRLQEPDLKSRDDAQAIVDALERATYWVREIDQQRKPRHPWPPFTTSTMQQAGSAVLKFAPRATMRIAQQLYEGLELGAEGNVGLITYMRTDSTHVAPEAQAAAREVIERYWGREYVPPKPPTYKTKVKSAQEAHEAIRPTDPARVPKQVRAFLDDRQNKLYELIWRRFIASQMKPALYDVTTAYIPTALAEGQKPLPYLFRAQGRTCVFDGFLKVWDYGKEQELTLPALVEDEPLDLLELRPEQHWTKPPPRYTEAALIRELERRGIGRPSTFASMVAVIKSRGYVVLQDKVLVPTTLGLTACDMLVAAFPVLFDYGFTAEMEKQLDDIANGQAQRVPTLTAFWDGLSAALDQAPARMPKTRIGTEKPRATGAQCPLCGGDLVRRKGRYGYFVGCTNYPTCRYSQRKVASATGQAATTKECPQCGGELVKRKGRHGAFCGCSNYPNCTYIERPPTPEP